MNKERSATPPLSIAASALVQTARDADWQQQLPAAILRRTPRIWHLAYAAVERLLQSTPCRPRALLAATALGALDETATYLDGIFGSGLASPRSFIASVHNSLAGKLAIDFGIRGPNITICDGPNSFASALGIAEIIEEEAFPVIVLLIDEYIEIIDRIRPHLPHACAGSLVDQSHEGAAAVLLQHSSDASAPRVRAAGPALLHGLSPAGICAQLGRQLSEDEAGLLMPEESANSSIRPGRLAHEIVEKRVPGRYLIGSYSPSARSAAIVELRV